MAAGGSSVRPGSWPFHEARGAGSSPYRLVTRLRTWNIGAMSRRLLNGVALVCAVLALAAVAVFAVRGPDSGNGAGAAEVDNEREERGGGAAEVEEEAEETAERIEALEAAKAAGKFGG